MRNEAGRGSEGYLARVLAGLPFALIAGVVAISFGVLAELVTALARLLG